MRTKAQDKCAFFLLEVLKDGPVLANDIKSAGEARGLHWRSMKEAKKQLRVQPLKTAAGWKWVMGKDAEARSAEIVATQVEPAPAQPGPAFTIGQMMMGAGAAKLSTGFAQPRLVPLWSAMGRRRA